MLMMISLRTSISHSILVLGKDPLSSCIMSAVPSSQPRPFLVRPHLSPHLLPDSLLLEGPALGDSARRVVVSVFDFLVPFSQGLSPRPRFREVLFPPDDHHPSRRKATRKVRSVRLRSSRSRAMLIFDLAGCSRMAPSCFPQKIVASQISTRRSAHPYRSSS